MVFSTKSYNHILKKYIKIFINTNTDPTQKNIINWPETTNHKPRKFVLAKKFLKSHRKCPKISQCLKIGRTYFPTPLGPPKIHLFSKDRCLKNEIEILVYFKLHWIIKQNTTQSNKLNPKDQNSIWKGGPPKLHYTTTILRESQRERERIHHIRRQEDHIPAQRVREITREIWRYRPWFLGIKEGSLWTRVFGERERLGTNK